MILKDLSKIGRSADEYDVVIVGGGTAGCVLASRLSWDPSIRVLLLEAGDSSAKLTLSRVPAMFTLLFGTDKMFNLYTTAQTNLVGAKEVFWPRGKMLGGCSAINAQIFHYGAPSDYDEWARLGGPGAESWAYKDFNKYFLKFEKFIPSKAHPGVDASQRGSSGPVEVGFHGNHSAITEKFIEACDSAGIPRTSDLNTARGTLGVAKFMTYINERGIRVSTESAYLTPDVLARPNLTIAVGAHVTRILFDTGRAEAGGQPRAIGVEFAAANAKEKRFSVKAKREVILSAGAIHSPHIMLLSGIGPAAHLKEHNIPVVTDHSGVGAHLMDHPVVDVVLAEKGGFSLNFLKWQHGLYGWFRLAGSVLRYFFTGTGPLTTNVAEAAAFIRSTDPKLFPPGRQGLSPQPEDVTSGPIAPDIEFFVSPMGYLEQTRGSQPAINSLGLHISLLRPTSQGSITLKSADPFDSPVIDPNYLSTENDIAVILRGMDLLNRVAHTAPLADIVDHTATDPGLGHHLTSASPEEMRQYISAHMETLYHPTSTARMAPRTEGGVVDARLRVYDVQGLRVVDASIFPNIIAGHTAGPAIAVAEKAADMIKEDFQSHPL